MIEKIDEKQSLVIHGIELVEFQKAEFVEMQVVRLSQRLQTTDCARYEQEAGLIKAHETEITIGIAPDCSDETLLLVVLYDLWIDNVDHLIKVIF